MGTLGQLFGGLIFVGVGILGAIAWGLYAFIFLGIFGIVDGATANPVDVNAIVWGAIWVVFLAKVTGSVWAIVGMLAGGAIIALSGGHRPKAFGKW